MLIPTTILTSGGGASSVSYAKYADIQSSGTNAGTSVAGSYETRPLNTEVIDADGIGSLSSNQITLGAGTYRVSAVAPFLNSQRSKLRWQNVTDAATAVPGISSYCINASDGTLSVVNGQFTIAASKTFELQSRCEIGQVTFGMGIASSFGDDEIYATVELWKLA